MLTTQQLLDIIKTQNVIFGGNGCPFYKASVQLLDALLNSRIISQYTKLIIDQDYTREQLLEVCVQYNWQPQDGQSYPSKPQVFLDNELIGGNFEFYKSKWNRGELMPNIYNPMRF